MEIPIEQDVDVERTLAWLHDVGGQTLAGRLEAAKAHFSAACLPDAVTMLWPDPSELLPPDDLPAGLVLQAHALVRDRRFFDARLASRFIPFIKSIGRELPRLDRVEGARERAIELLNPRNVHPEGSLLELTVAARYLNEGYDLRFITETGQRTPDLELVTRAGITVQIECKRLRSSDYEVRETKKVRTMFALASQLALSQGAFVCVDIVFKAALKDVPNSHMHDHMVAALRQAPDPWIWDDETSKGSISPGNIEALRADTVDSSLLVGPKLFRLFAGQVVHSQRIVFGARGTPHDLDPRYIDAFESIALCSWDTVSEESISARARNVRSKLAEIDQQLHACTLGAAHIVVDAERGADAADARRSKIKEQVTAFQFASPVVSLTTHYLLTHTAEETSWVIDETADVAGISSETLLDDPRLLPRGVELGSEPAWRYAAPA
ncbi:hypothetical protein [Luteimonas fraxinea]|uniref:Restriction endonuclease n=1 Tax=Luteimonas fraxinea TaxID=2901869 RepID=A0ABS8UD79_9GAMM|nr:hypothetical protein [Luteimonas fraxinea]MCD9096691.1 hypothetical protein [Luteimonas fraxinea]MCD9126061.1 hypothetical protein [Luteimonas fraxinea]